MYKEISSNIGCVKKNHLNELRQFLDSAESSILTCKQHKIMSLRAMNYSMDEIGRTLNVSKTAVYKSIKLSEKKIKSLYHQVQG